MSNDIRLATIDDVASIQYLIAELGFEHSSEFIHAKLQLLLESSNDLILVYELEGKVVGLITVHFAIQLAFSGDIMSIGYMVVDPVYRGKEIGKYLEEYAYSIAKEKKCSLIEVYSQAKRTDAHRFYERQGYIVAEKFFSKDVEN